MVVPAYNEERPIGMVIERMPDYLDKIVIVDDNSQDKTAEVVKKYSKLLGNKLILMQHEKNQGVGGAIATGYKWARDHNLDIAVVMAGDGQMDPEDLPAILDPVVKDRVD